MVVLPLAGRPIRIGFVLVLLALLLANPKKFASNIALMENKRIPERHRMLKHATIMFGWAAGISCVVRNLSPTGACLEVASHSGIPDAFDLVFEHDKSRRACEVIWRKRLLIGVTFNTPRNRRE